MSEPNRLLPFAEYEPLIDAASGLTLAQVCAIAGIEPYSVQNWVKRGFVAHPIKKRYYGRQLARILLIANLKDGLKIETVGELMKIINGSADDERDDIITEEALYDCFRECVLALDGAPDREKCRDVIEKVIIAKKPVKKDAVGTLKAALETMVFAHFCGIYKKETEDAFEKAKKENRK